MILYPVCHVAIDAFSSERISKNILERLLKQDVFYRIKLSARDDGSDPSAVIYERVGITHYYNNMHKLRVDD